MESSTFKLRGRVIGHVIGSIFLTQPIIDLENQSLATQFGIVSCAHENMKFTTNCVFQRHHSGGLMKPFTDQ